MKPHNKFFTADPTSDITGAAIKKSPLDHGYRTQLFYLTFYTSLFKQR